MKFKLSFLIALLSFVFSMSSFAGEITDGKTSFTLLHQSSDKIVIEVKIGGFQLVEVQTPNGVEYSAIINQGTPILQKGAPDLQKLTTSVIISDNQSMQVSSTVQDFTTFTNINIAPSKGTLVRTVDPSTVPFTYSDIYSSNNFYPSSTVTLRQPYIIRDYRGQTIVINPIQYNPVTKELRIATDIIVELSPSNSTVINPLVRKHSSNSIFEDFDMIYKNSFLNYGAVTHQTRYAPLTETGNMLIICSDVYLNAMKPFVDWKMEEGMPVQLVGKSTAGATAAAIKTYIQNYYNTNGLAYLLIVGDATLIPASSHVDSYGQSQDSDQDYGFLIGSDHYPDIIVGRFSAESLADVNTQVDRTVQYEKTPTPGTWYKNGIGIGSPQGAGQGYNGLADWEFERTIIRDPLLSYNYSTVAELYEGSRGGADAAGSPVASDLSTEVNNGASIINYTGHGNINLIATTSFTNTEVDALTNTRKLPFVWIVGCQTGNFVTNTCFGEAWARATDNNGEPTGSIANLMSTINQSWEEPMWGQLEFNKVLTENEGTNIKRTFGGVSVCGLDYMNDNMGATGMDMTDTWTCFGDPSVMLRTDVPAAMTVTHAPTVARLTSFFHVNCNVDGARVCLYAEGKILGVGYVSGTSAIVGITNGNFNNVTGDSILVTVTSYNKIPYQGWVTIFEGVSAPTISDNNSIQIFPNPASDKITVDLGNNVWNKGTVRIYNALGQLMNEVSLANKNSLQEISISHLAAGVYNVEVLLDEKSFNNRVVVK